MNLRRLALALLMVPFIAGVAHAAPLKPYTQTEFDASTRAGKPVAVVVHADWCPVCKVQLPIQQKLMASDEFKGYTMLTLDFDRDKDILKRFAVIKQSTLIVFKGTTEVGRSIGDTTREGMLTLMRKAGT
jgi:thiol-disulfide isomerase/thioredoxin